MCTSTEDDIGTHRSSATRSSPDRTVESPSPETDMTAIELDGDHDAYSRALQTHQPRTRIASASNSMSSYPAIPAVPESSSQSLDITKTWSEYGLPLEFGFDVSNSAMHEGAHEDDQRNDSRTEGFPSYPAWMSSSFSYAGSLDGLASAQFQLALAGEGVSQCFPLSLYVHDSDPFTLSSRTSRSFATSFRILPLRTLHIASLYMLPHTPG
jgi:hypothetical protein